MESKETTYKLGATGLVASIKLERVGQQYPSRGDGIVVRATIKLPLKHDELPPELDFGGRVRIWNGVVGSNYYFSYLRNMNQTYIATTWEEAFRVAEADATSELGHLLDAIATREKALADAEGPEAVIQTPKETGGLIKEKALANAEAHEAAHAVAPRNSRGQFAAK